MSFEFPSEEQEVIPEEKNPYEKIRELSDSLLENTNFVNEEDIIRISPEKVEDETPLCFMPGFGVEGTSKLMMQAIADEGRNVISMLLPREKKINDKEGIPGAILQKAFSIIEVVEKEKKDKGEKFDGIGHSEGGLALALAASIRPDLFRNIVLIAPAGMMENDSQLGLISRFGISEGIEELKGRKLNRDNFVTYMKDLISHISSNPSLSLEEVSAMTTTDIFEMTKYLKEQGVGVGLICGVNDKVFPINRVIDHITKEDIDHFLSVRGNHGSTLVGDEYEKYTALAVDLLSNMSKKKDGSLVEKPEN
jgi:hypothetical protein